MAEHSEFKDTQQGTSVKLRNLVRGPFNYGARIADKLHVTPNMLSASGVGLVLGGAIVSSESLLPTIPDQLHTLGLPIIGLGLLMDALDGALARYQKMRGKLLSENGALVDLLADRVQEIGMFVILALDASAKGNDVAAVLFMLNAALAPLPSLIRALIEQQGRAVKSELALGSRLPRVGFLVAGTQLPQFATPISSITATTTVLTTLQRAKELLHKSDEAKTLSDESIAEARQKVRSLIPLSLATLGLITYLGSHIVR